MLAKDTEERYPDYDSLLADIEAIESGREPPVASRRASQGTLGAEGEPTEILSGAALGSGALGGEVPGADSMGRALSRRERGKGRAGPKPYASGRLLRAAPWVFLAAALVSVAAGLWALGVGHGAQGPDATWLGSWHERLGDERDLVQANFSAPSVEPSVAERLRRLLLTPPAGEAGNPPRLAGGLLSWDDSTGAIPLGLIFERIDEVRVFVGPTKGPLDLGIGIADPLSPERRSLEVRLRLMETTAHPVLALRFGSPVGSTVVEGTVEGGGSEVPSVGPGPFEVSFSLERADEVTRLQLRIHKRHEGRAHYRASFEVPGVDWAGGFVFLRTESPVRPFSASLERLLISGRLAADPNLEGFPWRS
jgi:hypothetical protein